VSSFLNLAISKQQKVDGNEDEFHETPDPAHDGKPERHAFDDDEKLVEIGLVAFTEEPYRVFGEETERMNDILTQHIHCSS
jgi:hypothetical protein